MKRFWSIGVAAILAVAVVAGTAAGATGKAAKVIAFSATYAGNATTSQTDNTVAINANGAGKGTILGSGKVTGTGTGDSSQRPCIPFTGTGAMTGGAGTINFKVISGSNSCGDEQGEAFAIVGHAAVVNATGKLKKAKGTLKFTGTYNRSSGAFTVKFSGKLTQ